MKRIRRFLSRIHHAEERPRIERAWAGLLKRDELLGVALVMAVVTMVASYLPARRATRIDPLVALRCE